MLAEVANTSYGLLFVSKLPGAVSDPHDHSGLSFASPTAVLPKHDRVIRARGQSRREGGPSWQPIPITIVRILLNGPIMAPLWVKCADHGPAIVDRLKLNRVYERDQQVRRTRDTPKPAVIRLHDVGALSSNQ